MTVRPPPPLALTRRQIIVAGSAMLGVRPASAAWSIAVSFAPARPGGAPAGFDFARTGQGALGAWSASPHPSDSTGYILTQTSSDPTDYRFPLAIYHDILAADAAVTVRFQTVSGNVDQAAGIALRLTDASNYYVVRANALEDNVNLYRVVQGSRREIKGASARVSPHAWHELGLAAEKDRFTIRFNGAVLFSVTDRTFAGPGRVALWTKADSVTRFDAMTIQTP